MRKAAEDAFSFNGLVPILLSTHSRDYITFTNVDGHLLPATNTHASIDKNRFLYRNPGIYNSCSLAFTYLFCILIKAKI